MNALLVRAMPYESKPRRPPNPRSINSCFFQHATNAIAEYGMLHHWPLAGNQFLHRLV
jgi:hypothetical protein